MTAIGGGGGGGGLNKSTVYDSALGRGSQFVVSKEGSLSDYCVENAI